MRWIVALETSLALLLAFFVAPFTHVHREHHEHAGIIHSHFYSVPAGRQDHHGPAMEGQNDDDHAEAWSLDTFTIVLTAGMAPFVPKRGPTLSFIPSEFLEPVEIVEECAHDPPAIDRSIPRAPPS
jgi:hypothetical protein